MSYISRKEEALKNQIIPQTKNDDFEEFWKTQLDILRSVPIEYERKKVEHPYKTFDTYEINFNTHDKTIVRAYFSVPKHKEGEKLPCVAVYHGGGGSHGIFTDIVSTGVCVFCMDVRSQGGYTYDKADYNLVDDYRGALMNHGLLDKNNYYMRNIYLDAVRCIDVIATLPEVDSEKIVSYGGSQGGALTIVSGAFSGKVKKVYPSIVSYCCLEQRVEAGSGVFGATKEYLTRYPEHTDAAMDTLSYFDINNIASMLKVPALFNLGLMDPICIPPFVYSVYEHTAGPKEIIFAPFTPHRISAEYMMKAYDEFSKL